MTEASSQKFNEALRSKVTGNARKPAEDVNEEVAAYVEQAHAGLAQLQEAVAGLGNIAAENREDEENAEEQQ